MKCFSSTVLNKAKNLEIDLSLKDGFILITQNLSSRQHAALSATMKLLSILNKETLLLLGYTQ